jgi:hypothetical protein
MTVLLEVASADVMPERDAVLHQLGMPRGTVLPERIEHIYQEAAELFARHVAPAGILADVSGPAFERLYRGDGRNAPRSPVGEIAPRAEHIALFAVTLGQGVSEAFADRLAADRLALAYTLDAMASAAADGLADLAERRYTTLLRERGWSTPDGAVLRYSPGYCGWDVTGQRSLFSYLRPAEIGISLTKSCLMQPLKSVSGAMIAGPRAIHRFPPTYPFCESCEARTCRDRLRELFARAEPSPSGSRS